MTTTTIAADSGQTGKTDELRDRYRAHAVALAELAIQWMDPIGSNLPPIATREEYVFRHARLAARAAAAILDPVPTVEVGTRVRMAYDRTQTGAIARIIAEDPAHYQMALHVVSWDGGGKSVERRTSLSYLGGATWRSWAEVSNGK